MIRVLLALAFIVTTTACSHQSGNNGNRLQNREFKPNEDVQAPATVKRLMTDEQYLKAVKEEYEKKELNQKKGKQGGDLNFTVPPACECCWIRSGNCNGPVGRYCLTENDGRKSFFCPSTGQVSSFQCVFIFGEGCFSLQDYSDTIIASPPAPKQ